MGELGVAALTPERSEAAPPTGGALVFVTLSYHPTVGGAERQLRMIAEEWARRGHAAWVVTRAVPGAAAHDVVSGVEVFRLRTTWRPGLALPTLTAGLLAFLVPRRRQVSLVWVQMLNVGAVAAAIAARVVGVPLIVRPSAGGADGNLANLERSTLGRWKTDLVLRSTSLFVAMNGEIADELRAAGVPQPRVKRLPNLVETERFRPLSAADRHAVRAALGLRPDDVAVLFSGRLEPVKNAGELVSSWAEVTKAVPQAHLLLVGDGSERAMLEERSRSSSAADRIHFLGWRNDLPGIYAAADVFVLPSHREGVSSALLEAMSSALPSVAARVGGTGEVIAHEENGLLVDAERPSAWPAAVIRIARDAALRSRLGASARRTAEAHHARDAVFERYGHLRSIVSKPHFQKSFPILAYHRIRPRAQYGIDVTVDEFDRQLRWLREQGYRGISLRELYDTWSEGLPFPERSVVITFDDGHREICEHALPVMRRHGFRATLFVSPGLLGKEWWVGGRGPGRTTWHEERPDAYREGSPEWRRYSILSWSELEDLARDGMEIASHGWTHPFLTCLSDDDLDRELVASRQGLAAKLGTAIDFLCYPSGDFDERVKSHAARAGYAAAVFSPSHYDLCYLWDDPYAFERIMMWSGLAGWKFRALVRGWYTRVHRSVPRTLWRLGRTVRRFAGAHAD